MKSSQPDENLIYNPSKAGLPTNFQNISHQIQEVSKGTKYFQFQKERSKIMESQIKGLKKKLNSASKLELDFARLKADAYLTSLESRRNFSNVFLHADLDAFFASVEALIDPSLKGIPFAVGGSIKHGVISTSSYEARAFGVRSGMAIFIALNLCPQLKIVECHFDAYIEASNKVKSVFARYDPDFVSFGLDEATLNISQLIADGRDMKEIALEIQQSVYKETNLTISIGIATTSQLAKMASDINKPNGICIMPFESQALRDFLAPLKIRKIPGIGGVTERKIQALGVETIGDIIAKRAEICHVFSDLFIRFLFSSAIGCTNLDKSIPEKQQSFSKETTFDATNDLSKLFEIIENLALKIAKKLQKHNITTKTITVKFKDSQFQKFDRSITLDHQTSKTSEILNAAIASLMYEHRHQHKSLRLMGVKVSNLLYPGEKRQESIIRWCKKESETQMTLKSLNTLNEANMDIDENTKKMLDNDIEDSDEKDSNDEFYGEFIENDYESESEIDNEVRSDDLDRDICDNDIFDGDNINMNFNNVNCIQDSNNIYTINNEVIDLNQSQKKINELEKKSPILINLTNTKQTQQHKKKYRVLSKTKKSQKKGPKNGLIENFLKQPSISEDVPKCSKEPIQHIFKSLKSIKPKKAKMTNGQTNLFQYSN